MGTLRQQIEKMKALNIKEAIENAMLDTQDSLTAAQRDQMLHGEKANGKKIGKYKNKKYAEKKYAMNKLAGKGFKDLKLTGEFHKDIIVDVRQSSVVFSSADPKTADIVQREGEGIFGLNKEYAGDYSKNVLKNAALKRINNELS